MLPLRWPRYRGRADGGVSCYCHRAVVGADDLADVVDSSGVADLLEVVSGGMSVPVVVLVVACGAVVPALIRSGLPRSRFRSVMARATHEAVVECAMRCGASVALVDLSCPLAIWTIEALTVEPGSIPVLALGESGSDAEIVGAVMAGAGGYLCPTEVTLEGLAEGLAGLASGRGAFSLEAVRALRASRQGLGSIGARARLTGQQRRVVQLASQGYTNREIAAMLSIEVSTVKKHLHAAFAALGVSSRSELRSAFA
jgi:DNA-binding NarL/FixJ family response regulator